MLHNVSVIHKAESEDKFRHSVTPRVKLCAIPSDSISRNIIKECAHQPDSFTVFDATTGLPSNVVGMSFVLTLYRTKASGDIIYEGLAKVVRDSVGLIQFKHDSDYVERGTYHYEVTVRAAKGYQQTILSGTYSVT